MAQSARPTPPRIPVAGRAYLPEVDGLRACAALSVVAYHMNLLPVGWAGVWLFFVLSGFVITWMLLGMGWRLSASSYLGFARRRAARIWPLYFLYAALAVGFECTRDGAGWLSWSLALASFTYNFQAAGEAGFRIFHHLWTISVEQQFYLLYPLVFAACLRWRSGAPIVALVALALALRIAEFLLAGGGDPGGGGPGGGGPGGGGPDGGGLGGGGPGAVVFYWSFGQFDAFGVGALVAWHAPALRRAAVHRGVLAAAGAVVLCVLAVDVAGNRSGRGLAYALAQPFIYPTRLAAAAAMPVTTYLMVVAVAAAALATAIGPESAARRALRWPPLVRVGRISYGLYVWHMVVVVGLFALVGTTFAAAALPLRLALLLPCVGLSTAVAAVSYRCYESRFHRRAGGASEGVPPAPAAPGPA